MLPQYFFPFSSIFFTIHHPPSTIHHPLIMTRSTIRRSFLVLAVGPLVGPVAIHAKTHQECLVLNNPVHLCDVPVTCLAFDLFGQVALVAEIDMVGKIM